MAWLRTRVARPTVRKAEFMHNESITARTLGKRAACVDDCNSQMPALEVDSPGFKSSHLDLHPSHIIGRCKMRFGGTYTLSKCRLGVGGPYICKIQKNTIDIPQIMYTAEGRDAASALSVHCFLSSLLTMFFHCSISRYARSNSCFNFSFDALNSATAWSVSNFSSVHFSILLLSFSFKRLMNSTALCKI